VDIAARYLAFNTALVSEPSDISIYIPAARKCEVSKLAVTSLSPISKKESTVEYIEITLVPPEKAEERVDSEDS
jgi:hypothetical protein